jgi:hypothetical protein
LFFPACIGMRLCLQVSERDGGKGYSSVRRFSFAVIDLDKAEVYPLNFVCILPMQLSSDRKTESAFLKVFGDKRVEVAQKLLLEALGRESDSEVKGEIERRLKLFEPKPDVEKRCLMCGAIFQAKPKHGFKQKYCPECLKKKSSDRKQ